MPVRGGHCCRCAVSGGGGGGGGWAFEGRSSDTAAANGPREAKGLCVGGLGNCSDMLGPGDSDGTAAPGGRGFLRMGEFQLENGCAGGGEGAEEGLLDVVLSVLMA